MDEQRLHVEHAEGLEQRDRRCCARCYRNAAPTEALGERTRCARDELMLDFALGDVNRHGQSLLAREPRRRAKEIVGHRIWRMRGNAEPN